MSRGILYVAFGVNCSKLAASTIAYSRQFTDLPICVLTNVKIKDKEWSAISNITFIEVDALLEDNRNFKTQMHKFTPFEETLYLDCDSVIQKFGIEEVFTYLFDNDIVLNSFLRWEIGDKIIRLYRHAMKKTITELPLSIYNGAFICFKKNEKTNEFFSLWNKFWKDTGRGREMPALACAVKQSKVKTGLLKKDFFSPDYFNPQSIVQHNYTPNNGPTFFDRYKIPIVKLNKSFDKDVKDWNWVDYE